MNLSTTPFNKGDRVRYKSKFNLDLRGTVVSADRSVTADVWSRTAVLWDGEDRVKLTLTKELEAL